MSLKLVRRISWQRVINPADVTPEGVVTWLNANAGKSPAKRIARIIKLQAMQHAAARWHAAATTEATTEGERIHLGREGLRLLRQAQQMNVEGFVELDELMGNYWVSPR